ncbi:hypothetical protein [Microvirga makkahensis]|uniref:Uncharacterized protein n=1 Tax=Microvirga makkahensis TaxID=1128670 RepID=A0A7X3SMI6_9HYPH|nr:hypothetical protein [Microvirga makkahensis]MXQ10412.1 hypothetical protein [Microvirga makkahensis]
MSGAGFPAQHLHSGDRHRRLMAAVEGVVMPWIRTKCMDTPFWRATYHANVGGVLVLPAGIFIGNA